MLTWMAYGLLVSCLIAVAAMALDEVAGCAGAPRRFGWLIALVAGATLCLTPLRDQTADLPGHLISDTEGQIAAERTEPTSLTVAGIAGLALAWSREAVQLPLRATTGLADGKLGRVLGAVWFGASATMLLVFVLTLTRYRAERRRWPRAHLAGTGVRVSAALGPAVIGVLRPEIVVPAWLLGASQDDQRLVMMHEREHLNARDPLLLALGTLAVMLMPWNPVAWWMLHRLRLAVELDCDARVLASGAARGRYGELLIDMAGRGAGLPLRVAALGASSSTLEQRLVAMARTRIPFGFTRAAGLGLLGSLALITACEARMPTAAEVDEMDVATVERRVKVLTVGSGDDANVVYEVDGRVVSAEEARALVPEAIGEIEVNKEGAEGPARIRIRSLSTGEAGAEGREVRMMRVSAVADEGSALLFIDGVRAEPSRLRQLEPEQIATVEVIKGDAAVERFGDAAAANGVIRITTKAAAERKE